MSPNAIFVLIVIACWLTFIVVWAISSLSASAYARRSNGLWVVRFIAIVIALAFIRLHGPIDFSAYAYMRPGPIEGGIGASLCVLGVAFAIWARVYLGRNWGMPMSLKQDPDLVTSGPYAYVRHPIYTGMLLMMIGSALAISLLWLVALVFIGAYFIYSAVQEQKLMLKEFPDAYPAYMERTKMLIPFVF